MEKIGTPARDGGSTYYGRLIIGNPIALKIGDKVMLKSGGPVMTIVAFGEGTKIECMWFDDDDVQTCEFPADALKECG